MGTNVKELEKVIKAFDGCPGSWEESDKCYECPFENSGFCTDKLHDKVVELLNNRKPKEPVHFHQEYPEHDWKTNEKGEVDDFAWGQEYCNGPMCKRCYYAFCIHCEPNGWDKKPCIVDFFKCPDCGERISKNTKFCDNCGQAVKWE